MPGFDRVFMIFELEHGAFSTVFAKKKVNEALRADICVGVVLFSRKRILIAPAALEISAQKTRLIKENGFTLLREVPVYSTCQ
jgi:hypothetical protein